MPAKAPPVEHETALDPCPTLPIEKGPEGKGVGPWVWADKHRLLANYLWATRSAWARWPRRFYLDPFCATGRIQAVGESATRPGGAVRAWLSLAEHAPFTGMLIGDKDSERATSCEARLKAIRAPARAFPGLADDTVPQMVQAVPSGALCMAYLDPYNLELLTFSILHQLATLKVDLAINFSTMDLSRNVVTEFGQQRSRFDAVAPGWRDDPGLRASGAKNMPLAFFNYWCKLVSGLAFEHSKAMPLAFFNYWCKLVSGLAFEHSKAMPLVCNNEGHPIYRMVFFTRHPLPKRIWDDIARGPQLPLV